MTFDYKKTFPWSNYHFDSTVTEPITYLRVGRFELDFTDEIEQSQNGISWTWNTDLTSSLTAENNPYEISSLSAKKMASLTDADKESIMVNELSHLTKFKKMASALGLEDPVARVHVQRPGSVLHLHVDFLRTKDSMRAFKTPDALRRFVVMLSDWEFGQVFQFGTHTWTRWQAGDCITWDWADMPHGTCNMGFDDRYLLQLTGISTELTNQILDTASPDRIIQLCDS